MSCLGVGFRRRAKARERSARGVPTPPLPPVAVLAPPTPLAEPEGQSSAGACRSPNLSARESLSTPNGSSVEITDGSSAAASASASAPWKLRAAEELEAVTELVFLGKGAQGIVYKGTWNRSTVAVKYCVVPDVKGPREDRLQELYIAKALSHPHVITTFAAKVVVLDTSMLSVRPSGPVLRVCSKDPAEAHLYVAVDSLVAGSGPCARAATGTLEDVLGALVGLGAKPGDVLTQLVMEVAQCGSLADAIKRGVFRLDGRHWPHAVALRAMLRTMCEVARGMAYLHASGVLHGDLKPGNVLLASDGRDRRGFVAKLADMGVARLVLPDKDHVSDAPLGTLLYTAPERVQSGQLYPASDAWAFGVLLWQVCHGKLPFSHLHRTHFIVAQLHEGATLEWTAKYGDGYTRLSDMCARCMASRMEDRPKFAQLVDELEQLELHVRTHGIKLQDEVAPAAQQAAAAAAGVAHPTGGSTPAAVGV